MCHYCQAPQPNSTTRRSFLKTLAGVGAATAMTAALPRVCAAAAAPAKPQPGHTGWARLITPDPFWGAHDANDPDLAEFIRTKVGLRIDQDPYAVKPSDLDGMCRFPMIFSTTIIPIRDERDNANLREYLYRGGFLYIDGCVNPRVTPSFQALENDHLARFPRLLPGCEIRRLMPNHEIFHTCFPVDENELSSYFDFGHKTGFYAVIDDDRMVALLSLDALQCGWPQDPARGALDMKQIANIYAYALAH